MNPKLEVCAYKVAAYEVVEGVSEEMRLLLLTKPLIILHPCFASGFKRSISGR
jgi:hypothetical protein